MLPETEMTYDDMKKAVDQGYLCAKCQGMLVIAWGGAYKVNSYILYCGNDINHTGITRHDKKYEQKIKEGFSMDSKELMLMTEAKMMKRVEMARFPQELSPAEKKLLAEVAITYGFDPLMGEVTIYEGRPYVSIDGRYRKAQETGRLDGVETRPASKKEKEEWQIPEGDWFFRSEVYVKGASHPFIAWGRVRASETKPGSRRQGDTTSTYKPIQNNPQRMAEKRAEAQALRKAFHIPLPSVEDIGSPDYDIESTSVDVTTGEITEAEPTPKPSPDNAETQTSPVAEEKGSPASPVDMDWLRESMSLIHWTEATAKSWITSQLKVKYTGSLDEILCKLSPEQVQSFIGHVTKMREASGK